MVNFLVLTRSIFTLYVQLDFLYGQLFTFYMANSTFSSGIDQLKVTLQSQKYRRNIDWSGSLYTGGGH